MNRVLSRLMTAFVACAVPGAALAAEPAGVDELRALAAAGKHAEVIARADALLKSGPNWSLSFGTLPVDEAHLGVNYGYFRVLTGQPAPPVLPDKRHPKNANEYGWLHYVTCVDLRTGKPLWSRAFVPHPRIGIDPRDDSLWVWHEKEGWFEQIEPASGDTRRRGEVPTSSTYPAALECLRDRDADIWAGTTRNTRDQAGASRLDLETKLVQEDAARPFALSPGGLRRLFYTSSEFTTTVTCRPPNGGKPVWTFQVGDTTYNPPTWFGRDAIVMAGGPYVPAVLYRLDGETGAVRWRTPLGAYGFSPTMQQLRGGNYASGGWTPIGTFGDEVWAIDLSHRLRFFNAVTGAPTRRRTIGAAPVAPPRFLPDGETVLLATTDGIKRRPLDPAADPTAAVAAEKTRSLLAMKKGADAISTAAAGAKETDAPQPWDALAEALVAAGRAGHATAARVRSFIASGAETSQVLRKSHGLLWRLETGPVTAAPFVDGDAVLMPELDGTVRTIDPAGCREVAREHVEGGIYAWTLQGDRLVSRGGDNAEDVVRVFADPPAGNVEDSVHLGGREEPLDTAGVDRAWYTLGGGIGPAQRVRGRLVRATAGGGVRELVDKKLVERGGQFPELERWSFGTAGERPVGYGVGGVYALDDATLLPVRKLVDLGEGKPHRRPEVLHCAGDGKTIALLARDPEGVHTLQVRAAGDGKMIRSAKVVALVAYHHGPARLIRLGDGYFLSSGELLYLPDDPAVPEWRFGLVWDEVPYRDWTDVQAVSFGAPRVVGDRLLLAGYRGGVYVFDVRAICGR